MKYKLLFLLGIFTFIINAHAQTEEDLQRKYFTARNRLKKFFVEAGPLPGMSIPTLGINLSQC